MHNNDPQMTSHTPGKWVVMYDDNYGYWIKPEGAGKTLQSILDPEEFPQAKANAHLMANAPELYDTLLEILDWWPLNDGLELRYKAAKLIQKIKDAQ